MKQARYALWLITLLFILTPLLEGQEVKVERSEDKVIIEGVQYYIHIVKKGQTPYSISKAYGISVDILVNENPSALYGIREGQGLKIPYVEEVDDDPVFKDTRKYIYHTIQSGETIYSLSRRYDVTEQEIVGANPGLDIFDIPEEQEIRIPRKLFEEEPEDFVREQDLYYYHQVRRGESLSSLARKYDVPLKKIKEANPNLRNRPEVGKYVRIPGRLSREMNEEEAVHQPADSLQAYERPDSLHIEESLPEEEFDIMPSLNGEITVALLLPLYLNENDIRIEIDSSEINEITGEKVYKEERLPSDWIYPRSKYFIEFYEGALLAMDSLRNLGLNIRCQVFDTGEDTLQVERLLRLNRLRNVDLIIGPVFTEYVYMVAEYAKRYKIPLVSPLSKRDEVLERNPYVYKAEPGLAATQDFLASLICEHYDKNLVFIHSGSPREILESQQFKNKIFQALRFKAPFDEVVFKEVLYNSETAHNDTINVVEHALEKDKTNVIVLSSRDEAFLGEVISIVHTLQRDYQFIVYGYPEFQNFENIDLKYFHDLKLNICTSRWIDYTDDHTIAFLKKYREYLHTEPSESSPAWNGYDITFYFLSGLARFGEDFLYYPGRHNISLTHMKFDLQRSGFFNGFENQHFYQLIYAPDLNVYRIR